MMNSGFHFTQTLLSLHPARWIVGQGISTLDPPSGGSYKKQKLRNSRALEAARLRGTVIKPLDLTRLTDLDVMKSHAPYFCVHSS